MSNERYPLRQVIFEDLISHNKVALLLLAGVICSAIATIWIVHQTRLLVTEQSRLIQSIHNFENQYAHLQLDENSLSNKTRIEALSEKFGLQPLNNIQETILEEK